MKYIHIPTGVRVESDAPLPEATYKPAVEAGRKAGKPAARKPAAREAAGKAAKKEA